MADDNANGGKKPAPWDCKEDCPFYRIGLPILPVRYAVVKNDDLFPKLSGDLESPDLVDKPLGDGGRYAVRMLRTGYLYVYDEARKELKGYYVNKYGTLFNFDLDKPVDAAATAFTCSADHEAKAVMLTIPNARKATNVWLAFTDVQWTRDVCKAHKGKSGAEMRERHMFRFDVQKWLSSKKHPNADTIKNVTKTVVECLVENPKLGFQEREAQLDWTTVGYMDVKGWMGSMIEKAAEDFSPGKGLMLALPDTSGILQDVARLMRRRFDDFVSSREDIRPLTVSKSIESLREIIMQAADTKFLNARSREASNLRIYGTSSPGMSGYGGGMSSVGQQLADAMMPKAKEARDKEAEALKHPSKDERDRNKWEAWKKYLDDYDENARAAWQNDFNARLAKFDADTIAPLATAHAAWMTCKQNLESFQCNYDSKDINSGDVFLTVFSLCIDGTQDKKACFDLYLKWLAGDPVDTTNLLLRAMLHNQDMIADLVVKAHEASADWKAIPWSGLLDTYKRALKQLSDGAQDKTARLIEQLVGVFVRVLKASVENDLARRVAAMLGILSRKPVEIVEVVGSKKTFRAALIREVLRQHGANVDARKMERAVADELRRLEVRGENLDGTDKKRWFMLVDREAAANVPQNLPAKDRAEMLARTLTLEQYEAREMGRWRTTINTDVRLGAVGCVFQTVTLYKLWSDLDSAMDHERSDASWKFVVGIASAGGALSEVLGVALKARGAAGMRFGAGLTAQATSRLMVRWGSRFSVIGGVLMAVFDLKSGYDQIKVERNGIMGGLYIASGVLSLALVAAFAMSSTVVGLALAVLLIVVALLIEYFKDDKIQEWLKRTLWGKLQGREGADYYYGVDQEVKNLHLVLGDN